MNPHFPEFPTASITLYSTLFLPIPMSFGRVVSTFLPFIFSRTVNELIVIPGSFSLRELSVNEKSQFTVATFFPLSLLTVNSGPGQVRTGASQSELLTNKEGHVLFTKQMMVFFVVYLYRIMPNV